MDKRPNQLQALTQTMGLSEIIAIIIGVPAMIVFIATIWHSLNIIQQIIAGVLGIVIVFCICLFIYGHTRKILYVIPDILYKMHLRASKLASEVDLSKLNIDDIKSFLALGGVDFDSLFTEEITTDNLVDVMGKAIAEAEKQSKQKTEADNKTATRAARYVGEKTGVRQLLAGDSIYNKLTKKLRSMRPLIPTPEISMAVNKYVRTSEAINDFMPLLGYVDKQVVLAVFPLEQATDSLTTQEQIEDGMTTLLSEVRKSINRYYRGD